MAEAAIPLLVGSTILQAGSAYQSGQNAKTNANFMANQYSANANLANASAGQQQASGIANAQENLRQNQYLQSRIISQAAANGADPASNPSIANLVARTAGEGEYQALNSIYEGNSKADQLRNQAIGLQNQALVTRYSGKQAAQAGEVSAFSDVLGGAAKGTAFYNKYNNPAPTDTGTDTGGYY